MAPTPPSLGAPGAPGALLDLARLHAAPRWPPHPPPHGAFRRTRGAPRSRAATRGPEMAPTPPAARSVPADPGRSSISRGYTRPRDGPHTPRRTERSGGPGALLDLARLHAAPRWPPHLPPHGAFRRTRGAPRPPTLPTFGAPRVARGGRRSPACSSAGCGEGRREADGGVDGRAAGLAPLRAQSGAREGAAHARREPAIAHHAPRAADDHGRWQPQRARHHRRLRGEVRLRGGDDAARDAVAPSRAAHDARGERGHGAYRVRRRRKAAPRALVGGRAQPLAADPERRALVAEQRSEPTPARPAPAR